MISIIKVLNPVHPVNPVKRKVKLILSKYLSDNPLQSQPIIKLQNKTPTLRSKQILYRIIIRIHKKQI